MTFRNEGEAANVFK